LTGSWSREGSAWIELAWQCPEDRRLHSTACGYRDMHTGSSAMGGCATCWCTAHAQKTAAHAQGAVPWVGVQHAGARRMHKRLQRMHRGQCHGRVHNTRVRHAHTGGSACRAMRHDLRAGYGRVRCRSCNT